MQNIFVFKLEIKKTLLFITSPFILAAKKQALETWKQKLYNA